MKEVLAPSPVTDVQLYLLIRIPAAVNALLIGLLMAFIHAKFNDLHRRLDDMRDLSRSELHRVEGALDARLRHIEEERR